MQTLTPVKSTKPAQARCAFSHSQKNYPPPHSPEVTLCGSQHVKIQLLTRPEVTLCGSQDVKIQLLTSPEVTLSGWQDVKIQLLTHS